MNPSEAASLRMGLGACSVGVLVTYGGYLAFVVPWVERGGSVSPFYWAVHAALMPLGVVAGGALAPKPLFCLLIGAFTASLRMAVEAGLALTRAPGFFKANVKDSSVPDLMAALLIEALVWAAVAFFSFKMAAFVRRRRAARLASAQ